MIDSRDREARLVEIYERLEDTPELEDVLVRIRDLYELKHVTYQAARFGSEPENDPYVRTTYSPEWIKRYLQKEYMAVDPIMREGFHRVLPFDWSEFEPESEEQLAFFMDAWRHGVGRSGFAIPMTNKAGNRGTFYVNSDLVGPEWEHYKKANLHDLMEIGQAIHRRVTAELWGSRPETPRLAAREAECLTWIAHGKEVPDIAIILGLSEHTVRSYLKSARLKLGCGTMAQAVFKASRLGLLSRDL